MSSGCSKFALRTFSHVLSIVLNKGLKKLETWWSKYKSFNTGCPGSPRWTRAILQFVSSNFRTEKMTLLRVIPTTTKNRLTKQHLMRRIFSRGLPQIYIYVHVCAKNSNMYLYTVENIVVYIYIHIYISAHNMYIVVIECYEYHSHHFMMLEISRASILATVPTFFLTNVSWHIFWIPSAWQIFWHIFWQSWRFNHDNFYGTSSLTYSMFCQVPWHLSYICLQYVLSISLTFILHMPTYKRCQL
jgi:hypothetical protein